MHWAIGNDVPRVDVQTAKRLYTDLHEAMVDGLVASCHDCSDGGIGVAVAETAFAGGLGISIDLLKVPQSGLDRDDELLFSESQSRFIVTVSPQHRENFERIMQGNVLGLIGTVTEELALVISGLAGKQILEEQLEALKAAWQKPLDF